MSKRRNKPRAPFPPRFQQAFEMACAGIPKPLIAKATGYSVRSIYRNLAKPEVRRLMIDIARDTVAEAAPRAALKLTELMAQTESKKVSLDATTHILGTAGIRPPPASAVGAINLNVGLPMPSRAVISSHMSDAERLEIEAEWRAYAAAGGAGYCIDLTDRHCQLDESRQARRDAITVEPEQRKLSHELAPVESQPVHQR